MKNENIIISAYPLTFNVWHNLSCLVPVVLRPNSITDPEVRVVIGVVKRGREVSVVTVFKEAVIHGHRRQRRVFVAHRHRPNAQPEGSQ